MTPNEAPHYSLCTVLKLLHLKKLVALRTLLYLGHRKCLAMMAIKKTDMRDRKQILLISMCPKVQYSLIINTVSII